MDMTDLTNFIAGATSPPTRPFTTTTRRLTTRVKGISIDAGAADGLTRVRSVLAEHYGIKDADKLGDSHVIRYVLSVAPHLLTVAAHEAAEGGEKALRASYLKTRLAMTKKLMGPAKPVKPGKVVDSLPPASSFGGKWRTGP